MTQSSTTAKQPVEPKPHAAEKPPISPMWVLAMVGALFVAIVLPRLRRRRTGGAEPMGTFDRAAIKGPREELERLLTDIQDLSREHIARLDTKIRMLDQLLLECDRKKRDLEALLGRDPAAGTPAPPPAPMRPANPLHEQVYSLKDSGKEVADICTATGLEKGEVELILGLRRMPPERG